MNNKKPEYLISKGINDLLQNRYGLNLSEKRKNEISKLETEFVGKLEDELINDFEFKTISQEEINFDIDYNIKNRHDNLPLINLDDVYFKNIKFDDHISITRLINDPNDFSNKTLGPRKGELSLEKQLENLEKKYQGSDVALVDIGVFEGETLLSKNGNGALIPMLAEKGISVKKLYVSIFNEESRAKFENSGIEVISGKNKYDFKNGDWLEVRDLLGFDGRKFSTNKYFVNSGTHLFARYIQDPNTLKTGASINDGVTAAIVLDLCNMYQKKIMREIRNESYQVFDGFINSDPRLYTLEFKRC